MFDLAQIDLPKLVDAYGKRWIAVYRIWQSADLMETYLAIENAPDSMPNESRAVLPAQCFLIQVTKPAKVPA